MMIISELQVFQGKRPLTPNALQLEDQNAHLREQNAKCNVQLELLRGRLAHLSTMHTERDRDTEVRCPTHSYIFLFLTFSLVGVLRILPASLP